MNSRENNNFEGFKAELNMKTAYWSGDSYWDLTKHVINYLKELDEIPPSIPVEAFFTLFRRDDFSNSSQIDFNSLTDEQKTFISMIDLSGQYTHCLTTICANFLKNTHRIFSGDVSDYETSGEHPEFEVTVEEVDIDELDEDEEYVPLDEEDISLENEECAPLDNKVPDVQGEDNNHDVDFIEESNDTPSECNRPTFDIKSLPKIQSRSLLSYSTTPPLRTVFNHLTHIKKGFLFLLEWFYNYFGPVDQIPFDYKIYNSLSESIIEEDFEQFSDLVYRWDDTIVNQLSIMVELFYPTLHYIEYETTDFDTKLNIIKKDLVYDSLKETYRLPFSSLSAVFNFIIIYIFRHNVERYLELYQRMMQYIIFADHPNSSVDFFFKWVDNETEIICDYFRNIFDIIDGTARSTIENTIINSKDQDNKKSDQVQFSGDNPNPKDDDEPEPPEDPKAEVNVPDYIKVPCGRKMLEKLVKGLIDGHKDETLGNFSPLVTSKTGEDRESIKKKLICLFTGEGINDESIMWPYDLKWNDHANSLKLLVYLLHYEKKLPDNDPFKAINEKDSEGISDAIRTNFRGKKIWSIVGTALGYGENTLRNKVKIPQESNISLMKKLAQFWFDCKILGD